MLESRRPRGSTGRKRILSRMGSASVPEAFRVRGKRGPCGVATDIATSSPSPEIASTFSHFYIHSDSISLCRSFVYIPCRDRS